LDNSGYDNNLLKGIFYKKKVLMINIFISGFLTGLILQAAVGPVFFYILNLSIQRTLPDGLYAVLGVTIADYIYIILAILGVGKLLENRKAKIISGIAGSLVLIIFGIVMIVSADGNSQDAYSSLAGEPDYFASLLSAFLLTISSPLTIVFWSGIFISRAVEKNFSRRELLVFGFSAGFATVIFLGIAVVLFSGIKSAIPSVFVYYLNIAVGLLLIIYAVKRFAGVIRKLV
jgi:threonine/homoserine/homoserine lactone efflux protein